MLFASLPRLVGALETGRLLDPDRKVGARGMVIVPILILEYRTRLIDQLNILNISRIQLRISIIKYQLFRNLTARKSSLKYKYLIIV